jgi:hypothetical protein
VSLGEHKWRAPGRSHIHDGQGFGILKWTFIHMDWLLV